MIKEYLGGKLHNVVVTKADLNYTGSIGIAEDLMRMIELEADQLVHVWNLSNGERIQTYVIALPAKSKRIEINGAAAHKFSVGDRIIIAWFYNAERKELDYPLIEIF